MAQLAARNNRVPLRLDLEIRGRDAGGVLFRESTRSLNVSGGGICFESRARLPVGVPLTLQIQIPIPLRPRFRGRPVYRVRAIVCRVEWPQGQPFARVGARFLQEVED
jgi:hypothetical protein